MNFKEINPKLLLGVGTAVVIILGSSVGLVIGKKHGSVAGTTTAPGAVRTDKEVGVTDTTTFRDSAQGRIEKGGLAGEGTHQLVRDGGPTQTVYLLSSIVDLDEFAGKKVEVWGETLKGQKTGWLMDVGRVKLLE